VKALLVRLSAIGDVVHTLPVLAALHEQGWQTAWLVEPLARPLLAGNPALSELIEAPAARAFTASAARRALREVRRARAELRGEVGVLATQIAERLVRKSLNDDDQQRLVREALARIEPA